VSDIVVHHLEQSRSHRVLWLLEELKQPFTMKTYKRHPKTMRAGPELKAIHPLGRFPAVEIDGVVYAESGAILETLLDAYDDGTLRPRAGTEAFRHYRYFLHYAEGSLMTPLFVSLLTGRVRSAPLPFFVKPIALKVADNIDRSYTTPEVTSHLDFLESHLKANPWFAGDSFSAADIQMSYGVEAAVARGGGSRSVLTDWVARISDRPAYQAAVEKGGPTLPPGE
jgi:glutathione S-transferase